MHYPAPMTAPPKKSGLDRASEAAPIIPVGARGIDADFRAAQTARLAAMRDRNQAAKSRAVGDGDALDVVTYNGGLLSALWVGTPGVTTRGPRLAAAVAALDADVILMQEVWNKRYKRSLRDELPDYHVMFSGSHRGLVTLIRKSVVAGEPTFRELRFPTQRVIEYFIYHKTAMLVEATHAQTGQPLVIVNVHLAAGSAQKVRLAQVDQTFEHLVQPASERALKSGGGQLIVGGDLNASPYYASDRFFAAGRPSWGWRRNAAIYNKFADSVDAIDAFAAIHGAGEVAAAHDETELEWATQHVGNRLVQITRTANWEPSQRVDFIFARPIGDRSGVHVEHVELGMKDRFIDFKGERVEQSDHYCFRAYLRLHEWPASS